MTYKSQDNRVDRLVKLSIDQSNWRRRLAGQLWDGSALSPLYAVVFGPAYYAVHGFWMQCIAAFGFWAIAASLVAAAPVAGVSFDLLTAAPFPGMAYESSGAATVKNLLYLLAIAWFLVPGLLAKAAWNGRAHKEADKLLDIDRELSGGEPSQS